MSLISVTPKLDAFTKFCSEQPSDRTINHSETYDECAIGDFTPRFNAEFRTDDWIDPFSVMFEMMDEVCSVGHELEVEFNRIGFAERYPELATYGGMTQWLLQFQHKVREYAQ